MLKYARQDLAAGKDAGVTSMLFAQMHSHPKDVRIVPKTRTFRVRLGSRLQRIVGHVRICGR